MTTQFVTALSIETKAIEAGRQAARQAKQKLKGGKANLGILFCSQEYPYSDVLKGIQSELGEIPIIGCSSAGEFTEEGVTKKGVALALIESDAYRFFLGLGKHIKADEIEALRYACKDFPPAVSGFPNLSAMLFLDGLSGKGEETVLAASSLFGEKVKFSGGAAADNLKFQATEVFCDGKSAKDAVSICFTASKKPVIIKVGHGHTPLSESFIVTKAKDSVLYELDGKPAGKVWKDYFRTHAKALGIDPKQLNRPEEISRLLLKHEAGLMTRAGYKLRFPTGCNPDDSMNFVCTIAEGAAIKIMDSKEEDQISSARATARAAIEAAKGIKIAGAVVFDCACRAMILKNRFAEAIEAIKEELGDIPVIGFETYGEIAMETGQLSGFHNTTTVITLIPE